MKKKKAFNILFLGLQVESLNKILKNNDFKKNLKNIFLNKIFLKKNVKTTLTNLGGKKLNSLKSDDLNLTQKTTSNSIKTTSNSIKTTSNSLNDFKELEFWTKKILSSIMRGDKKALSFFGLSATSPIILQSILQNNNNKILLQKALKIINKFGGKYLTKELTKQINHNLINNEYIYKDKVKEKEKESTTCFLCRHFYINIKIDDLLVLTKDFPDFGLYTGMVGRVTKLVGYQQVEVSFILTSKPSICWSLEELQRKKSFFIKEKKSF